QSITVSESGTYFVTTQGLCNEFTSTSVSVDVLSSEAPLVQGDTIAIDQSATLFASGSNLQWYENQTDNTPIQTGDFFETPVLSASTTYWVSSTTVFDTPNEFVGMVDHQGTTVSDNSYNGTLIFDCFAPFKLHKVKVYTTKAGIRKIDLLNSAGQTLQSTQVDIPVGTSNIDIDFDIEPGTDYVLTTDPTVNQASIGTAGPQLYRSNQGISFPYVIDEVLSIKNSSFGLERYYYFFNWEVDFYGYECTSARIPVTAFVDPNIVNTSTPVWADNLRLFPNPTSGLLKAELDGYLGGKMSVSVKNTQGSILQTRRLDLPAGQTSFQTDLSAYPKGVYWLEMTTEKGAVQRRIVLQ
ncbi:MAG: T9SS type A sorting domain-containing protein, partial [Saprospiraceae bacterium]|nr:T9SS type A sorting domain-containing protein [Saprospiraceae bacterium]